MSNWNNCLAISCFLFLLARAWASLQFCLRFARRSWKFMVLPLPYCMLDFSPVPQKYRSSNKQRGLVNSNLFFLMLQPCNSSSFLSTCSVFPKWLPHSPPRVVFSLLWVGDCCLRPNAHACFRKQRSAINKRRVIKHNLKTWWLAKVPVSFPDKTHMMKSSKFRLRWNSDLA